jgi:hypothetical protein
MFQVIPLPEHLKTKQRDATREQFMKALASMEIDTMIEVPDSYYKYATVRGRVSHANKWLKQTGSEKILRTTREGCSAGTIVKCEKKEGAVLGGEE